MSDSNQLSAGGWTLSFAHKGAAGTEAVLTGDPDPREPAHGVRRGILGAVAQALDSGTDATMAGRSASLAVSGLIDGFFSARPTLGQGRAAAEALNAVNGWMLASHGAEALAPGFAAALSAIAFGDRRVSFIQVGVGMILRLRGADLARLAGPQLIRIGAVLHPRRFLGADSRLLLDFSEDEAEAGDRYILLSDARGFVDPSGAIDHRSLGHACRTQADRAALAQSLAGQGTALVIDVLAAPQTTVSPAEIETPDFPLRPVPQEGDNRDGYLIGRTIHRGAYTLVKRATDSRSGQLVALKFPLPAMLNDQVFQAGFAREAWISASVHSPLIGHVITPPPGRQSSLYIVMPYYRGETLEARLARDARMPVAEVVAIGLQLCQAVEDLRAQQILHRDLKPGNIMLQPGGTMRLLDLGLAYLTQMDVSTGNGLGGTLRYMAPELMRDMPPSDRTEVYAIGLILHQMAAFGRFPRPSGDIGAALEHLRPDLPPSLRQAIQAALSNDPAKRPGNGAILGEMVGKAVHEGAPTTAAPRLSPDPLTLWRGAAIVLGLVVMVLVALRI